MKIDAYPLQWPAGWPRLKSWERRDGAFKRGTRDLGRSYTTYTALSIADAVTRVRAELQRMRVGDDDIVISTNLHLRLDGLPKSGQAQPEDPGVAVYWRTRKGETKVMAIDQYKKVEHNLAAIAAIAATLDAMRAIERHGGAQILDRAFAGFKALPGAGESSSTADVAAALTVLAASSDYAAAAIRGDVGVARQAVRQAVFRTHPDRNAGVRDAYDAVEKARRVLSAFHGVTL